MRRLRTSETEQGKLWFLVKPMLDSIPVRAIDPPARAFPALPFVLQPDGFRQAHAWLPVACSWPYRSWLDAADRFWLEAFRFGYHDFTLHTPQDSAEQSPTSPTHKGGLQRHPRRAGVPTIRADGPLPVRSPGMAGMPTASANDRRAVR